MSLQRRPDGYIEQDEFYDEQSWREYLRRAMARRRDYRPIEMVAGGMMSERVGKQVGDRSVDRNSHEAFDAADPQPDFGENGAR